jgi:hypothetical protein
MSPYESAGLTYIEIKADRKTTRNERSRTIQFENLHH